MLTILSVTKPNDTAYVSSFRELTRYTTITILSPEKRNVFSFEWMLCLHDRMYSKRGKEIDK